jgi:hypothetical protein
MTESSVTAAVRFAEVYRRHLSLVASLEPADADLLLHRKLVMFSILDALSRAVFPNSANRGRFVSLLRQFATWPESERISLPHLVRLLSRSPDPGLDELRAFAGNALGRWLPGHVVPLSEDPDPAQVLAHLPTDASLQVRIARVQLGRLQHAELFYTYRNSLVHELRTPAHDLRLWETPDPHYVHLTMLGSLGSTAGETTWQLQYTNRFLARIVAEVIESVQAHLIQHHINVFDVFDSGEYWIAELNQ